MKNIKIIIGVIAFLGLVWLLYPSAHDRLMSAALKRQKDNPEIKIFDGENEPSMPNASDNNKTILGIDSNNNGIRDDIDIWINRTAIDYNERMGMRQYARAEQESLRVCSLKLRDDGSRVSSASQSADACLNAVSDYKRRKKFARDTIDTLTISNWSRRNCLGFYDEIPNISSANASQFHENCNFKIEKLDEVINRYHVFWGFSK